MHNFDRDLPIEIDKRCPSCPTRKGDIGSEADERNILTIMQEDGYNQQSAKRVAEDTFMRFRSSVGDSLEVAIPILTNQAECLLRNMTGGCIQFVINEAIAIAEQAE